MRSVYNVIVIMLGLAFGLASTIVLASDDTNPKQQLMTSISQFASETLRVPVQEVIVIATDDRLRVPSCAAGFEHDFPFGDGVTVRSKCRDSSWQSFIRIRHQEPQVEAPVVPLEERKPATVLVVAERIHRGQRLSMQQLDVQESSDQVPPDALSSTEGLGLLEATRMMRVGEVVRASMVKSAPAVKKGERVTLAFENASLSVEITVEALVDGQFGEIIRFRNIESGTEVQAEVVGIGIARLR
jgi:flagellar basal body P-ring formation protein FlgA